MVTTATANGFKTICILLMAVVLFASAAQAISLLFMFSLLPQDNGFLGILRTICSDILGVMLLLSVLSLVAILANGSRYFYYIVGIVIILALLVALY